MRTLFADSSFFIAALNESDAHHEVAEEYSRKFTGKIITTEWVLVEVANFYSTSRRRATASAFIDAFRQDPKVQCVGAVEASFDNGWAMYKSLLDKEWSLTDCLSFHLMNERKIPEALTADHHFEQAGFKILLT